MRLVVVAARNGDVCQARPLVRNEAARALESEHTGGKFWRNTDHISKALTEMTPAIADLIRELVDWHRPMGFRQSSPRPRDFGLRTGRVELRDKCPVQHGKPLLPRIGPEK